MRNLERRLEESAVATAVLEERLERALMEVREIRRGRASVVSLSEGSVAQIDVKTDFINQIKSASGRTCHARDRHCLPLGCFAAAHSVALSFCGLPSLRNTTHAIASTAASRSKRASCRSSAYVTGRAPRCHA